MTLRERWEPIVLGKLLEEWANCSLSWCSLKTVSFLLGATVSVGELQMIGSKSSFLLGFYFFFHRIHGISVFSCVGVCFTSSQVFLKFSRFWSFKPQISWPKSGPDLPGEGKRKGNGTHNFSILWFVCRFY